MDLLKDFITKNYYDFERPDINLYNFHPQLIMALKFKGVFKNRNSRLRLIWPVTSIILTVVGVIFEVTFVHKGIFIDEDYSLALESFCYLVYLGTIPCVYMGVLQNNKEILTLLDNINNDFVYICNLGSKYKKQFLYYQLIIWKACFAWLSFTIFSGFIFMTYPFIIMACRKLLFNLEEDMNRPLTFPVPEDLTEKDLYASPYYEVFVVFEMFVVFIFVQGFCGYVYLLFHFLLHYYALMDMIILDFDVIFEGLDESVVRLPVDDMRRIRVQAILRKRIKRIVTWHLSVLNALTTISSVFGPPLVYQVIMSSFAMCLTGYQETVKLEQGVVDFLFTVLFIGACLQLWIPCYLGTLLRNKGFAVGDACWGCGWHETSLGLLVRTDFTIIIWRSQIPIYIKFIGLPYIELETYSSIMMNSYSYYNMLRQYSQ